MAATGKPEGGVIDDNKARRKRKKAKKERGKMQEASTGHEIKPKNPEKLEIKLEPMETLSELHHSSLGSERQSVEQERTKSLTNPVPVGGEEMRLPLKAVKLEKMGKPRPSNLTIE